MIRSEGLSKLLSVLLDGAIVALAIVALGYEILLKDIVSAATASATVVAGQLTYPLLDLVVLTVLLIVGLGKRGLRLSSLLMTMGATLLMVTDTVNLNQVATATYVPRSTLVCRPGFANFGVEPALCQPLPLGQASRVTERLPVFLSSSPSAGPDLVSDELE